MFVTPCLDFATSRLWWVVALLELGDEQLVVQYWHSQFLSLHIDFLSARLLRLIVTNVVSTLLEIVENIRIDLQHDDFVGVHFFTGRSKQQNPSPHMARFPPRSRSFEVL